MFVEFQDDHDYMACPAIVDICNVEVMEPYFCESVYKIKLSVNGDTIILAYINEERRNEAFKKFSDILKAFHD